MRRHKEFVRGQKGNPIKIEGLLNPLTEDKKSILFLLPFFGNFFLHHQF
jgi:hypothetical protein